MTDAFSHLSDTDLQAVIAGLRSRRISAPYSELQISRGISSGLCRTVVEGLNHLASLGFTSDQIHSVLALLDHDRRNARSVEPAIDLVTSGPEAPDITNRDTSVVVRELFAHAQKSVMVVGYAIYQGQKVFESLAQRMEELPDLSVQFFLNISRPDRDSTPSQILVSRFAQRFRDSQWPSGCRLPEVYYDPRSVADDEPVRSSLHAKCIVIDGTQVFVSSANFTEAGQQRNIEVGLKISSPWLAHRLATHFQTLLSNKLVVRAF